MADTVRTLAQLQALLADNNSGNISAQDLRDFLVTSFDALMAHNTSGWRDLISPLDSVKLAGISDPTFAAFGPSGGLKAWSFANGNEVFMFAHTRHDTKPGSTAYPHIHWTTNGTSTAQVDWQLELAYANGHDQDNFPASSTINFAQNASGTAWRHMITEDATGITLDEPDAIIVMRLQRSSATNADAVFGLAVDLHYEVDRLCTKNRAPDFYT